MLTVFQIWVDLDHSQTLDSLPSGLDVRLFATPANGESVKARDWPSSLDVADPEYPRANFFSLHPTFLLMDESARSCCASILDAGGETLQFNLGNERAYLFNPLTRLDDAAVDWAVTKGRMGVYYNLSLRREHVPVNSIFRITKMGALFCSSELNENDADFFTVYRKNALTGLTFTRLWDEHSGPVPNRSTTRDPI